MFDLLFPLLFFLQLQWLSIIAGMLWGRLSGRLNSQAFAQWISIAALLTTQACGSALLISQMACGQTANAIIQGVGSVCLCILGGFISSRVVPDLTTGWFAVISVGGSAVLYGWQYMLTANYWSMEWLMLFLLPTIGLFLLAGVAKIVNIFVETLDSTSYPRFQCFLSLILLGLGYLIFTIIATFAAAIAFDCGI
jgi:hypothetical protein